MPAQKKMATAFQNYHLTRTATEAGTGYFDCMPVEPGGFDSALVEGRSRPNDEFMRKHLLRLIAGWEKAELQNRIRGCAPADRFLRALFYESCLLLPQFAALKKLFPTGERRLLAPETPLVFIKAHQQPDHNLHRRWIERLRPSFFEHAPLPAPREIDLNAPVNEPRTAQAMTAALTLQRLAPSFAPGKPSCAPPADPSALTAAALERLAQAGVEVGSEMRHEASLSPIGLLREWQLSLTVECGRHRQRVTGRQTAYGRGLDLPAARVACVMEIVERASAYASIAGNRLRDHRQEQPLVRARFSELHQRGRAALDPNRLGLEAPYRDEPLYWMEGRTAGTPGWRPILVPAQAVLLFCNLDEAKLFSGWGSNGLGAGASIAEAKYKALLEVIERDSAATIPFTPDLCFDIETRDARMARLLQSYAQLGIGVGFLDITGPLGLPCCKCFVRGADGRIAAGTGAHLDARRALISALTETPYAYPRGAPSQPPARAAVRVPLEALPNYDRGSPEENLRLLEHLLLINGFEPIYVDLTRADLDLPVVRALVPGMELLGDFEPFSRVHPRLYGHYLKFAPAG